MPLPACILLVYKSRGWGSSDWESYEVQYTKEPSRPPLANSERCHRPTAILQFLVVVDRRNHSVYLKNLRGRASLLSSDSRSLDLYRHHLRDMRKQNITLPWWISCSALTALFVPPISSFTPVRSSLIAIDSLLEAVSVTLYQRVNLKPHKWSFCKARLTNVFKRSILDSISSISPFSSVQSNVFPSFLNPLSGLNFFSSVSIASWN